jgi:hypothetical protein
MLRTAALLAALSAASVHAQSAQRAREQRDIRQGKRELARGHAELVDDQRDLARIRGYAARLQQLRAAGNARGVAALDAEVSRFLAGEHAEARRETGQAAAEVLRSSGETVGAAGEAVADERRGRGGAVRADSRRDLRDDRRDLKDDQRDLRGEAAARSRVAGLRGSWDAVAGRFDDASLDARARLLAGLAGEQVKDLQRTSSEVREDRRELREDRRELREDRRQRK